MRWLVKNDKSSLLLAISRTAYLLNTYLAESKNYKLDLFFRNSYEVFDFLCAIAVNHAPGVFDGEGALETYEDLERQFAGNGKIAEWLA